MRRVCSTLGVVLVGVCLGATAASAEPMKASPSISRVQFQQGPLDPEIVIYGRHFGRRPYAHPPGGTSNLGKCGRIRGNTGKDYGHALWLDDHSQLWSAGYLPYVDCMGLVVERFSDNRIAYELGSFYSINYARRNGFAYGMYKLAEGDSVTIHVEGVACTIPVRYGSGFMTAAFDPFGGQGGAGSNLRTSAPYCGSVPARR